MKSEIRVELHFDMTELNTVDIDGKSMTVNSEIVLKNPEIWFSHKLVSFMMNQQHFVTKSVNFRENFEIHK